jgi:peptidoglycan/xylan/chitin deacetylase (PgdA/CDA1 family)
MMFIKLIIKQLNNLIKILYSFVMWYSGLLFLWLKIRAYRRVNTIAILNYHRIDSRTFEEHLRYITRAYKVITMEECYDCLKGDRCLPPNSIVITFDDAYGEFYYDIYPILKAYNVPAILFIPTEIVDKGEILWFDKIRAIVHTTDRDVLVVNNKTLSLKNTNRNQAAVTAVRYLNNQSIPERDEAIRKLLESIPLQAKWTTDVRPLTWDQLRSMHGLISYGAHTVTHPNLAKLSREQAIDEILSSKRRIEEELGCKVKYLAYPFGGPTHFTTETVDILKDSGFDAALTTIRGSCAVGDDLFTLRRIGANAAINKGQVLATRLSGLWIFSRKVAAKGVY